MPREWPSEIRAALAEGRISNGAALILAEQVVSQPEPRPPARRPTARPVADEYAGLFPPSSPLGPPIDDVPGLRASAGSVPLADEELHRSLFGDHVHASTHSADAAGAPGHVQFVGQHVHEHPDYSGGRHSHVHAHQGDANHAPGDFHPHPITAG